MEIVIRLPNGLEINFSGETQEFERFTGFLTELPPFVEAIGEAAPTPAGPPKMHAGGGGGTGRAAVPPGGNPLDPHTLQAALDRVGATSDIERITVMAQAAVEAGLGSLDFRTVDRLYNELALRKPSTWKAAFNNARTKGYLTNVAPGLWKPTVPGENYAKFGSSSKGSTGRRPAGRPDEREAGA